MTGPQRQELAHRQVEKLVEQVDGWRDAHEEAALDALKQLRRVTGELRALEQTIRSRHDRYMAELSALRHQLEALADGESDCLPGSPIDTRPRTTAASTRGRKQG